MSTSDGMTYDPAGASKQVVEPGEFVFSVARLDHAHINGMTGALKRAGGVLKSVYDIEPERAKVFKEANPEVEIVDTLERILEDDSVHCVAGAAIPNERAEMGMSVMEAGKDYFTDKSPFTTLEQLSAVRQKVADTNRKYMVYFSERLHNAPTYQAGEMARNGVIGDVLQVLVMAPHRLSKPNRPEWFFDKEKYGGILTDIGSHQFEQMLYISGASDAEINFARVDNFANADRPGLEDFGEASLKVDTGASCYCRIDWFTPDASRIWGDGRLFILGAKGYMEVRKYLDVGRPENSASITLVTHNEETVIPFEGPQHFPFFGDLILDILNRTENAMTQEHVFKAAELSMKAQEIADAARGESSDRSSERVSNN